MCYDEFTKSMYIRTNSDSEKGIYFLSRDAIAGLCATENPWCDGKQAEAWTIDDKLEHLTCSQNPHTARTETKEQPDSQTSEATGTPSNEPDSKGENK